MSEPTTSGAPPATSEDEAIRERVKGLTSQALQHGRVDPQAVKEIVRAVMGGTPGETGRQQRRGAGAVCRCSEKA